MGVPVRSRGLGSDHPNPLLRGSKLPSCPTGLRAHPRRVGPSEPLSPRGGRRRHRVRTLLSPQRVVASPASPGARRLGICSPSRCTCRRTRPRRPWEPRTWSGARPRACPAPPAASPEPRERPERGPRPGRAGPGGWARGRSGARSTALGPPAEEGTERGAAPKHPPGARRTRSGAGCGDRTVRARGLLRAGEGAESWPGPEPQREEMAATAAAAAEEGMEPRALQYEQTLVSSSRRRPPQRPAPPAAPPLQRLDRGRCVHREPRPAFCLGETEAREAGEPRADFRPRLGGLQGTRT